MNINEFITVEDVNRLIPRLQPIRVKTGYNKEVLPEVLYPDVERVFNVKIREVERVEIQLDLEQSDKSSLTHNPYPLSLNPEASYTGFMVVGNELRPLPIGSTLDPKTGIFSWQPGPGFIGDYEFVFVKKTEESEQQKIKLKIRIVPKFRIP